MGHVGMAGGNPEAIRMEHPVSGEGTEAESGIWRATQAPTGFYLENHIQQSKQCRHCCIFKVFHLFSAALFHLLA